MPRKKKGIYCKVVDFVKKHPGVDVETLAKHFNKYDLIMCEVVNELMVAGLIGKYKGK